MGLPPLKSFFAKRGTDTGLVELIQSIVQASRVEIGNYPERFFEVELKEIIRLRSDKLLSPNAIAEYLSPSGARASFRRRSSSAPQITSALRNHVNLGSLQIRIDGSDEPVYRPHRDTFTCEDKPAITFNSVDVIKIPAVNGDIAAIGWVLHHDYEGAFRTPPSPRDSAFVLATCRSATTACSKSFSPNLASTPGQSARSTSSTNTSCLMAVATISSKTLHSTDSINHLSPTARDIARRCRTTRFERNLLREFELLAHSAQETVDIILQQSVSRSERQRLALSSEQSLMKMAKIARTELVASKSSDREKLIEELKAKLKSATSEQSAISSPLMRLPKARQKTYEHLFELIYKCSTNRTAAKALIDRILMNLE